MCTHRVVDLVRRADPRKTIFVSCIDLGFAFLPNNILFTFHLTIATISSPNHGIAPSSWRSPFRLCLVSNLPTKKECLKSCHTPSCSQGLRGFLPGNVVSNKMPCRQALSSSKSLLENVKMCFTAAFCNKDCGGLNIGRTQKNCEMIWTISFNIHLQ